jgi:hypothetical protein
MRLTKRFLSRALAAGAVVVLAAALAAAAQAGVAGVTTSLKVTSAETTGACTSAGQAYVVHTIVTVANGNTTPVTVVKSDWSAKGKSPAGDFTSSAAVGADGGLTGSTVAARTTSTYRTDVTTIIPCDATSAQVCVVLTIDKGTTTGTTDPKCSDFVKAGNTVVPVGTVGLLGLTALLAAVLLGAQVLSRRRKSVELR